MKPASTSHATFNVVAACGLAFGIMMCDMAYLTFAMPEMKKDENFPMTTLHTRVMPASHLFMTMIGNVVSSILTDKVGRWTCIMAGLVVHVIACFGYVVAPSSGYMLVVRGLAAFGSSLLMMGTFLYLREAGATEHKDRDGGIVRMCTNAGVLLSYAVGYWLGWRQSPIAILLMSIICIALMWKLPESPHYLVRKNKIAEAIAAITVLRNSEARARKEVKQLVDAESGSTKKSGEKGALMSLLHPPYRRPLLAILLLVLASHWSGGSLITQRAVSFFEAFRTEVDPRTCTLLFGVFNFFLGILSTVVDAKYPRLPTLGITTLFCANCLVGLGVFYGMSQSGGDAEAWTRENSHFFYILMGIYYTAFSLGPRMMAFTYMGEGLPTKIKSISTGLIMNFHILCAIFMSVTFSDMLSALTYTYVLIVFAVVSSVFTVLAMRMMQETKHLSIADVDKQFEILVQKFSQEKKDQ